MRLRRRRRGTTLLEALPPYEVPSEPGATWPTYREEPGWPPPPVYDTTAPLPTLASLTPNTAVLGAPSFTLHVTGTGFDADAVIQWNGAPEPTTFVSETELTTEVDMSTAEVALEIPVAVRTAAGLSNVLPFTLTAVLGRSVAPSRQVAHVQADPGPCPVDDAPHTTCTSPDYVPGTFATAHDAVIVQAPARDGSAPRRRMLLRVLAPAAAQFTTASYRRRKP